MASNAQAASRRHWIIQLEAIVPKEELTRALDTQTPYSPGKNFTPSGDFASIITNYISRGGHVTFTCADAKNPDLYKTDLAENLRILLLALHFADGSGTDGKQHVVTAERMQSSIVVCATQAQVLAVLDAHDALNADTLFVTNDIQAVDHARGKGATVGFLTSRLVNEQLMASGHQALSDPLVQLATFHQNYWTFIVYAWQESAKTLANQHAAAQPT